MSRALPYIRLVTPLITREFRSPESVAALNGSHRGSTVKQALELTVSVAFGENLWIIVIYQVILPEMRQ